MTYTQNNPYKSACSHPSEGQNRTLMGGGVNEKLAGLFLCFYASYEEEEMFVRK